MATFCQFSFELKGMKLFLPPNVCMLKSITTRCKMKRFRRRCPPVELVRVFPSVRWSKYWSFSFSISPSNEQPGLIFFKMDWLDLLAVQGTLKSLLQHHSLKASILQRAAFFFCFFKGFFFFLKAVQTPWTVCHYLKP